MIITKDEREIELMAEAGRIVALVHKKLKEVIVPGITTNEIDKICDKVIRDLGATPSFLHLYGFPNSVCTSINQVVVHGIPSNRKLVDGDIISVDVGACYKGYHGDSAWTYAVGNVSDEAKRLMEVCEDSLYAGLKMVKPGNRLSDISHAIEEYLKANNKIDFDGMNLEFLNLLKNDESFRGIIIDEFDYIFVDEAQDINNIQYEILKYLTLKCNHLFMVGDP